jgi:hypothetical protein
MQRSRVLRLLATVLLELLLASACYAQPVNSGEDLVAQLQTSFARLPAPSTVLLQANVSLASVNLTSVMSAPAVVAGGEVVLGGSEQLLLDSARRSGLVPPRLQAPVTLRVENISISNLCVRRMAQHGSSMAAFQNATPNPGTPCCPCCTQLRGASFMGPGQRLPVGLQPPGAAGSPSQRRVSGVGTRVMVHPTPAQLEYAF